MIFNTRLQVQWLVFPEWESDTALFHAFSTRNGGVSTGSMRSLNLGKSEFDSLANVRENRRKFYDALGIEPDRTVLCNQIHSATVRQVNQPGVIDRCDGLITDSPNLYLIIGVADCHVIFLTTKNRQVVGALHAGWRGIQQGILSAAVQKIKQKWNYGTEQLELAISPGIGPCCYEIGEEVASQFDQSVLRRTQNALYLDMAGAIILQANNTGIPGQNMNVSERCTQCEKKYWYSYRRDRKITGRMWGVIAKRRK